MKVLVTGGGGFIGRHLVRELAKRGDKVVVLDSFEPVVHGRKPDRLVKGAVRVIDERIEELPACCEGVEGCEAVVHLAAGVSVSASLIEPSRFVRTNNLGTAVLWEAIHTWNHRIQRVVVASSMSVYGEGLQSAGISEQHPCRPASIYGASKYHQEQLSLVAAKLYRVPTVALRLFNTYGPGQSLTNAETGVVAIFAARILSGQQPEIYEDGLQLRDLVHVDDVVRAILRALDSSYVGVVNIGTGVASAIGLVAEMLCSTLSSNRIHPRVLRRSRPGDVRHCFADIGLAARELGWHPEIPLEFGLREYCTQLQQLRSCS